MQKIDSIAKFVDYSGGCFVRSLGTYDLLAADILQMDAECTRKMCGGKLYYTRISELPNTAVEDVEYYTNSYNKWMTCGRKELTIKCTRDSGTAEKFASAAAKAYDIFESRHSSASRSIVRNFVVKLISRVDYIVENADLHMPQKITVVARNIYKIQDYLLFYVLYLMGCKVLLIQNIADVNVDSSLLALSQEMYIGGFGNCDIRPYEGSRLTVPATPESRIRIVLPERKRSTLSIKSRRDISVSTRREKSYEELARLASSVVMIAVADRTGKVTGAASGIMIGRKGFILTNKHVIAGGSRFAVRLENDDKIYETSEVIKYHTDFDLAIIRIQRELVPIPIYSGKTRLVRGQKVVAIGSPMGLFNSVSDGIISGFRTIDDAEMIQFTAPTSHGSSGGAVLNMFGEVVGISTAGISEGQNLSLAVGYEQINPFVRGFV